MNSFAFDPVPFERDDFAETAFSQHQQQDDDNQVLTQEAVAGCGTYRLA